LKRQLTVEELEKTNKGINRLEKELEELEETIVYNLHTIKFQKAQDEYQDMVRPYLRKKREQESTKAMSYFEQELKEKQATLANLKEQVKDGVTIKNKCD